MRNQWGTGSTVRRRFQRQIATLALLALTAVGCVGRNRIGSAASPTDGAIDLSMAAPADLATPRDLGSDFVPPPDLKPLDAFFVGNDGGPDQGPSLKPDGGPHQAPPDLGPSDLGQ